MPATNFTAIQLYRSATASAVPLAANLVAGELALNYNDGRLYYEDSGGVVQLIGAKLGSAAVATFLGTPSSANLAAAVTDETGSGALVFGTSPTITFAPGSGSLPSITFTGDPNTGLWSSVGDEIDFSTGGTIRLALSTIAFTSALPVVHPLGAVGTPSITFTGDTNTGFWSPGADTVAVSTAGAERTRITSAGFVGVGIDTPTALGSGGSPHVLQVHSTGTGATSFGFLALSSAATGNTSLMGAVSFGSTGLSGADKRTAEIKSQKLDALTVNPVGNLLFQTANGGSPATRLAINPAGEVGINVTAAAGIYLHVKDSGEIARLETTTARGSGLCSLAFHDPTGLKGYAGYMTGDDRLYLANEMAAATVILAGATAASLTLASDGRLYGNALHNNAGSVTGTTNQYIASGTYTPTATGTANIDSVTGGKSQWIRVGNVVHVTGVVTVDATTATTSTAFRLTLPVASNLAASADLAGVAVFGNSSDETWLIFADTVNDAASFSATARTTGSHVIPFTFSYEVK